MPGKRRRSFQKLVEAHGAMAYRLAYRFVKDRDAAEDIVQAGCLKAYRSYDPDRLQDEAHARNWFLRAIHSAAIDYLRRGNRDASVRPTGEWDIPRDAALGPPAEGADDPSREAERQELRRVLQEEMEALPEVMRVALYLHAVRGLSYEEVAEIAGCPVGTVRSRIFHGRKLLRESMRSYDPRLVALSPVTIRTGRHEGKVVHLRRARRQGGGKPSPDEESER